MYPTQIRLGTRGSQLALKQADIVKNELLKHYPGLGVEIIVITTTGDKILDANLATIGGKGLFIKEIEEKLVAGEIDIAVHSLKDMPAVANDKFNITCVLERENPQDAFISYKYKSLMEMPIGSVLGTSSSRRAAQALNIRPDLRIVPLRGNIGTRLKKIKEGIADATFLAVAGLKRAGLWDESIMQTIPFDEMLPAVSQGAICIETLSGNTEVQKMLEVLNHKSSYITISAERSFMRVFEGSCTTPIAALAQIHGNDLKLECLIAKPDGSIIHRTNASGNITDAENIGKQAAVELKGKAGKGFFEVRSKK